MEADVDDSDDTVKDGTEEMIGKVDELEPGDTAEEEEGKDVGEVVRVADDGVGGDVIEDHTEDRVVAADELEIENVAEEKDDKALEVAEDTGMELEIDDSSGGFVLSHLYRSHRVSEVSSHDHVRLMWTLFQFDEDRDEVHLNVIDCDILKTRMCLREEIKNCNMDCMISYVLL